MKSLMLSPTSLRPRFNLITVLVSPEMKSYISQSVRSCMISSSEVICLIDSCRLLRESNLAMTNLLLPRITSLISLLSFILYSSSNLSVYWVGCCPTYVSRDKANKIFKIDSFEFWFLMYFCCL